MLAHLDGVGHIRHIEGKVREIIGRPIKQVMGQQVTEYIDAGTATDIVPMWLSLLRTPGSTRSV